MAAECLFCRIVRKEIPSKVVEETQSTLAFRDIAPRAPVHVLVIPKEHIDSLMQLEPKHTQILTDIHEMIQVVARKEKIDETGFRVAVNTGKDSGMAVPHLHYHVLGGRHLAWPPG